jgi:hypothetical protein
MVSFLLLSSYSSLVVIKSRLQVKFFLAELVRVSKDALGATNK